MVLVSLVLVISYASSLKAWLQQREELAMTRAQIADSGRSIASLQKDKRRWEDPAYVEQQARERFGWVLPGEVGYRVIGKDGETLGNNAKLPDKPVGTVTRPEWYDTLWGSVETAGKKPETEPKAPASSDVIKPDDGEVAKDDDGADEAP